MPILSFKRRLRRSRSCLEIYQRGENHEPSLLYDVYKKGARAAVVEVAGTPDPRVLRRNNITVEGSMSRSQLNAIENGFARGEKMGARRIRGGFKFLRTISTHCSFNWNYRSVLGADYGSQCRGNFISPAAQLCLDYNCLFTVSFRSGRNGQGSLFEQVAGARQSRPRRFRINLNRAFADHLEEIRPEPERPKSGLRLRNRRFRLHAS